MTPSSSSGVCSVKCRPNAPVHTSLIPSRANHAAGASGGYWRSAPAVLLGVTLQILPRLGALLRGFVVKEHSSSPGSSSLLASTPANAASRRESRHAAGYKALPVDRQCRVSPLARPLGRHGANPGGGTPAGDSGQFGPGLTSVERSENAVHGCVGAPRNTAVGSDLHDEAERVIRRQDRVRVADLDHATQRAAAAVDGRVNVVGAFPSDTSDGRRSRRDYRITG